jgi:hypothetical protein
MKFQIGFIFIFCTINAHTFNIDNGSRVKRSPQEGFFGKVKTGFTNVVTEVKKYTNKGVEEVKNLFASDRKVGDYRIDQLDVRFGGDEDDNSTSTENFNQLENNDQVQRDKREVNEEVVKSPMDDVIKNLEDQLEGKEHTTEGLLILQKMTVIIVQKLSSLF